MLPKIAAIQMCSSENVDENLQAAHRLIAEAAEQGARLIALPEMFPLITDKRDLRLQARESFGHGKIQDFLARTAQQYGVWLVGGTVPILNEQGDKVRAACLVYTDQGICIARYDKIHLFDVVLSDTESYRESDTIEAGKNSVIIETPVGRVGLAVCYDIRFPELFNELFQQGVEILVLPSAFTVKTGEAHWHVLTRARAIDTFCYVLAPAQSGTHASGRKTYGHSVIVAPWGNIVAECTTEKPGVICAEVDLEELYRVRKAIPIEDYK